MKVWAVLYDEAFVASRVLYGLYDNKEAAQQRLDRLTRFRSMHPPEHYVKELEVHSTVSDDLG